MGCGSSTSGAEPCCGDQKKCTDRLSGSSKPARAATASTQPTTTGVVDVKPTTDASGAQDATGAANTAVGILTFEMALRPAPHGERRPPALSTGDDHSQLPSVTSVVLHDAVGPRPESSGRGPSSPLNSANSRLSRRSASVLRYRPQGSSSSLSLAECALGLPASPIVSFVEPASTNASPLPFPLTQLSAAPRATPRMVRPN